MANQNSDERKAIEQTFLKTKDDLIESGGNSEAEVVEGFYLSSLDRSHMWVREIKCSEKVLTIQQIFWRAKDSLVKSKGYLKPLVEKVFYQTALDVYLDLNEDPDTKKEILETQDFLSKLDFNKHIRS